MVIIPTPDLLSVIAELPLILPVISQQLPSHLSCQLPQTSLISNSCKLEKKSDLCYVLPIPSSCTCVNMDKITI